MATSAKEELYKLAMDLFQHAKNDLAEDGAIVPTQMVVMPDGMRVCVVLPEGLREDVVKKVADTVEGLSPKAVCLVSEAWATFDTGPCTQRFEAITVSVKSGAGSWWLVSTFDRDANGSPNTPSAPALSWEH